jgi:hypothetical protein
MTPLKCPNPGCPFLFDPSQVPPGAVLACPRCGLRFTLGPTPTHAPPAPSEPNGLSFPKAEPPARKPAKSKDPEVRDEEPGDEVAEGRSISLKAIVLACLGVLILGGVAVTYLVIKANRKKETINNEVLAAQYGLAIKPLDASTGWEKNDAAKDAFDGKLFGYVRSGSPEAWIVADAKKYDYAVRPTDLKERMNEQLARNFSEVPPNLEAVPASLLGMPAQKFSFRGLHRETNAVCLGDVYAVAMNTVGIWIYQYAGETDYAKLEDAFQSARASLRKLPKAGGEAAPRFDKPYRSKSGLFVVTDTDGVWEKKNGPETQDAKAELWLRGTGRTGGRRDPANTADLIVAVLDDGAEAEKHVLAQMNEGYKTEPLTSEPTGDLPASGELKMDAEVTRLKLRYPGADPSSHKLIVYASVPSGGKSVVAYATCTLKDLEYWEQRLMQIVGSLKAGK